MSGARSLLDALVARGARLASRGGRTVASDLGDVAAEADALCDAAGVVAMPGLASHAVGGADARAFLHRMLTQDVRGLAVGTARPAALLDVRARVQGDPVVWDLGGRFLLVEEPAAAARLVPALARYVVADDVTVDDESAAWAHLLVAGPRADAAVEAAGAALAAAGARVASLPLGTRRAAWALVPAAHGAAALEAVVAAGARPCGEAALDAARVEALAPWFGAELDDRVMPTEAGLDAAVHWTKGCYLGQEPVVRARHRGRPPHALARLRAAPGPVPARDAPLRAGDAPAGRVTTAVRDRRGPDVVALALVRAEHARVGATLALEDGRAAVVEAVAR